ncbi:TetR/AcrR family transcriptional regulator [Leucobacter luti]|uniref:TetR family transcriptional regulator n=1 Tax=Leucobacter luti TaxID=340320 RepID=A0A4Q7U8S0_9MICO|nr:TetR/AcrR family transcriptional regulator [Leucobacter luti]MBL3700464.1 TetR/AcrR family transcriptional regulator [Leucobacter luti]RZT68702.1 TetR family transcriptional regulator [Leucobacter luti]
MARRQRGPEGSNGEQQLRDAAKALADAAGQLGQSFGAVGGQAETGVTKGLLAAAEALAQASAWVEQRARPMSTREQLLKQAARLFAERGFSGVSLVDIAQAAGFTKGAVYSHFGSKEQVFVAAVRSVTGRIREENAAAAQSASSRDDDDAAADGDDARPGPSAEDLGAAATLGIEALLFGWRVPEHRAEVRELVTELIAVLSAAAERLPADAVREQRVLARDETQFAVLAMRELLTQIADG